MAVVSRVVRLSEREAGARPARVSGRVRGLVSGGALALLLGLVFLMPVVAGCSSGGGGTTVTTAVGASSSTRTSITSMIIGDKTKEQYQAETADLEAKAKAAPTDLTVLQDLAVAYYMAERFQDAAGIYEQMLKIKETPTMRNNYGNMLRDMGKTEEAKAAYRTALEADPKLTVAYVNLASQLFVEGLKDEAYRVLDDGIAKLEGVDKTRLQSIKDTFQKQK